MTYASNDFKKKKNLIFIIIIIIFVLHLKLQLVEFPSESFDRKYNEIRKYFENSAKKNFFYFGVN